MSLKISPAWLSGPGPKAVMAALERSGHRAWYVGGCVRNALLDQADSDIDIATDARPDETIAAAKSARLKAVPTGMDHGTITVVAKGEGYEVTTLRRDVETDGRHARVVFSDRIEEDAARRDFTMNALYAQADGAVIDPLGGLNDLRDGRVRFIGDPEARIAEDYLRILRFFRFTAWYGRAGLDAEGLAACATLADGLERIAAERIGQEMKKLLAAPDPSPAISAMAQSGVLARVLPGADVSALAPLVHLEGQAAVAPDAMRRLAVIGGVDPERNLRLSRAEARRLGLLRECTGSSLAAVAQNHGGSVAWDVALVTAAATSQALAPSTELVIQRAAEAKFPLTAKDLMPHYQGAELGERLAKLKDVWIASDFQLDRDALLDRNLD